MRRIRFGLVLALGLTALGVSLWKAMHVTMRDPMQVERARIAAHLTHVEAVLRASHDEKLTKEQRATRARHLDVLHEYRERGVFPHNHGIAGRTPVFIDEHGTHCAVGYLIARSGRADLAQRIARTRKHARVAALAHEAELASWLEAAGLSLVEAATIQPAYGFIESVVDDDEAEYAFATTAATGVNSGLIVWNLLEPGRGGGLVPGLLGLSIGIVQIGLGVAGLNLTNYDGFDNLVAAEIVTNFVVGTASVFFASRTLRRDRSVANESRSTAATWHMSSWTARDIDAGMRVSLRF